MEYNQSSAELVQVPASMDLIGLGLSEADLPRIRELVAGARKEGSRISVEFGRELSEQTAAYTDRILESIRSGDNDLLGTKLNEVVSVARRANQELSLTAAGPARLAKLPIVGPVFSRVLAPFAQRTELRVAAIQDRFRSAKEQIDNLLEELVQTQANLNQTNLVLDEMFQGIQEKCRLLSLHIAAGTSIREEQDREAAVLRAKGEPNPFERQKLADLEADSHRLDKRIGDLKAVQYAAFQALPSIRIIQANNQMQIDKYDTIRDVTIPAWKQGFGIRGALQQQQKAAQLATMIDDATNALLLGNAKMVHSNSVSIAQSNQRMVIDASTLEKVQEELNQTLADVRQIQVVGAIDRKRGEQRMEALRKSIGFVPSTPAVPDLTLPPRS